MPYKKNFTVRPALGFVGLLLVTVKASSAYAQATVLEVSTSTDDFATQSDFDSLISYDRSRSVSVGQRPQPLYDPIGIQVGAAFDVLPRMDFGLGYDDNVFNTQSPHKSDFYYRLAPGVGLRMDGFESAGWASITADLKRYFDTPTEDESGWRVATGGRFDVNHHMYLEGGASTERRYEERDGVGTPEEAAGPVAVTDPQGYLRAVFTGTRTRNALTAEAARFDYDDQMSFAGATIDEHFRNQTIYRAQQRSEVGISPDFALLEAATYTVTNYDSAAELDNKDSHEARVLLGGDFDLTNLLRGEIGVGYLSRDFTSPTYRPVRGLAALAKVEYLVTQLTTLSLWARRAVDDAAVVGAGGFFANVANLEIDHELLRNLIVTAALVSTKDTYISSSGEDRSFVESLRVKYSLSRELHLNFKIDHVNRTTRDIGLAPSYGATRLMLTLSLQR
jgi:hypothetical protein